MVRIEASGIKNTYQPELIISDMRPYIDVEGIGPRLKMVYDWLKDNGKVKSERHMADLLGVSKSTYQRWVADYTPDTPKIHVFAIDALAGISVHGKCVDPWWVISGSTHTTGMEQVRNPTIPLIDRLNLCTQLAQEYTSLSAEIGREIHHSK